jgi:hypothetical protein
VQKQSQRFPVLAGGFQAGMYLFCLALLQPAPQLAKAILVVVKLSLKRLLTTQQGDVEARFSDVDA